MKQPFRFHRGELNGFYLYRLVTCANNAIQDIKNELIYHSNVQWKLEEEILEGELPIRREDMYGIGKIAGIFPLRTYGRSTLGSVWFTESNIVNNKERSERGLVDMGLEWFRFKRTEQDSYLDDIVNEANINLRMSLVPTGASPVKYATEDTQVYDAEGNVLWDNLLDEPPTDGTPYVEFYGEKFLTMEHSVDKNIALSDKAYKLLFDCMQRIRYTGASTANLLEITQILCEGYVYDLSMELVERILICTYKVNHDLEIDAREQRLIAWQFVCQQKFKLVRFVQDI
jgi:hypothetical protein